MLNQRKCIEDSLEPNRRLSKREQRSQVGERRAQREGIIALTPEFAVQGLSQPLQILIKISAEIFAEDKRSARAESAEIAAYPLPLAASIDLKGAGHLPPALEH